MSARHIFHIWIFFQNLLFVCVNGTGSVEVRLTSYQNKNGTDNVGKCCDIKGPTGCEPCDPYIQIYLSQGASGSNLSNVVTTRTYNDTNDISFGTNTGKTSNPFKLTFANFTNQFVLTLIAWDDDKFDITNKTSDRLEELHFNVGQGEPSPFYTNPSFVTNVINGNAVTLGFEYRISCSQYYYGSCNKFCKPKAGQYNCSRSGTKVCEPGWSGTQCDTGPCHSHKCEHNATCTPDLSGGYSCNCPPIFSGKFCDTRIRVSQTTTQAPLKLTTKSKLATPLTTKSTSSTNFSSSSIRQETSSSSLSSIGIIVGCSVAAILIAILLVFTIRFCLKKKHNRTDGVPASTE